MHRSILGTRSAAFVLSVRAKRLLQADDGAGPLNTGYDAEDLRLFALIYKTGSLSATERQFSIPKSTLSRSLARLEKAAGVALFDRSPKGLQPTALAKELIGFGTSAENAVSGADEVLRGASDTPSGKLVVAASATSSHFLLSSALAKFISLYPEVDVHLEVTSDAPDPQAEGIDLSIQVGWPDNTSLIARRILSGPSGLYVSPQNNSIDLGSVGDCGRIVISARDAPPTWREAWILRNETEELVLDTQPIASVGDPSIALDLIAAGNGVAMLPLFFATPLEQAGQIKRILRDWYGPPLELFAVLPPGRRQLASVRCFMELLLESARHRKQEARAIESV